MPLKQHIAIVGPGRLGSALARALTQAGYVISEVVSRPNPSSRRRARTLARTLHSRSVTTDNASLQATVIWFCVPDREIAHAAADLADAANWNGRTAFHSSGALTSDALDVLRKRGAAVASVHPVMTFVKGAEPSLRGVPFGIEGDAKAGATARQIVRNLGGEAFAIGKANKPAYHAWATMICPLLVSALVTAEQVAKEAGLSATSARRNMLPIVRQTMANYAKLGPAGAFSGPLVRGESAVIREHLHALRKIPEAREVYIALARAALRHLPTKNRKELNELLRRQIASETEN